MKNNSLNKILQDRKLARLGDSYINFIYSLALTNKKGEPCGIKVSDKVLFEAAKKSHIRELLPKRIKKGMVANAIESLLVYAWLNKSMSLDEAVETLSKNIDNPSEAIAKLSIESIRRLNFKND
ncbi:MAG: ribonuclease III family protein [Candidatus Bathyarchaeia archaeon]